MYITTVKNYTLIYKCSPHHLLSKPLNLCSSLNVRTQVSHPFTTGKILESLYFQTIVSFYGHSFALHLDALNLQLAETYIYVMIVGYLH